MNHVMTIKAYPRKAELGGGFRGALIRHPSGERVESPVLASYEAARHWAQLESHNQMGGRPYRRAYLSGRKHSYQANIWA